MNAMLQNLSEDYKSLRSDVDKMVGRRDLLVEQRDSSQRELEDVRKGVEIERGVKKLMSVFIRVSESRLQSYIEPIVTDALRFIFQQDLYFHFIFVERRNQIESDFFVIRHSDVEKEYQSLIQDKEANIKKIEQIIKESKDINFMYGGSINQVLAAVLLITLVQFLKIEGPIFMDEPTGMVNEECNARFGQFLVQLSKKFERQIVFATHSNSLTAQADKIYNVSMTGGHSIVTENI